MIEILRKIADNQLTFGRVVHLSTLLVETSSNSQTKIATKSMNNHWASHVRHTEFEDKNVGIYLEFRQNFDKLGTYIGNVRQIHLVGSI